MLVDSKEVLKARDVLVQHAFDEICAETSIKRFYSHTYYTLSKLGLNKTAQKEGLFTHKEDWVDPKKRNELLGNIKNFLIKHIK